jgi:tetratricopeptide (TPR) repeat protein
MNADMGQLYYFAREYDQAIAQCRKALEIDPDSMFAHQYLYYVYAQKGAYAEAVEEYLKFIKAEGLKGPTAVASLRHAYAASGWRGFLQTILKSSAPRDSPTLMAMTYAMLEDKEQAFKQLERAYDTRDFFLGYIKVEPAFEGLSVDPRYADLLRRMKLAPT